MFSVKWKTTKTNITIITTKMGGHRGCLATNVLQNKINK